MQFTVQWRVSVSASYLVMHASLTAARYALSPCTDYRRTEVFLRRLYCCVRRRYRSITIRPRPSTRSSPDIYTPGAHPSPDIANFCAAIIEGLDIGLLFTVMVGVIVIRVRG